MPNSPKPKPDQAPPPGARRRGQMITRARGRLKLTRPQLADLLDIHPTTLAEHEAGLNAARTVTMLAVECMLRRARMQLEADAFRAELEGES